MQQPRVEFLFDFGSPNAYFSHKVLPDISARTGVAFEYVPILLGGLFRLTNNRSPAEAFADILNKREYGALEKRRFIERHGLAAYRDNPYWPINTLQIMRGAIAARQLGVFQTYVDTVFAAVWERQLDMGNPDIIRQTLDEAGLDSKAIQSGAQEAEVKQLLIDNTQQACDRGAFGSPTFFVDGDIYFGKDRLREVEEAIEARKAFLVKQPAA